MRKYEEFYLQPGRFCRRGCAILALLGLVPLTMPGSATGQDSSASGAGAVPDVPADMQAEYARWKQKFQAAGGKSQSASSQPAPIAQPSASPAGGSDSAQQPAVQAQNEPTQMIAPEPAPAVARLRSPAAPVVDPTTAVPASIKAVPADMQADYRSWKQKFDEKARGPVSATRQDAPEQDVAAVQAESDFAAPATAAAATAAPAAPTSAASSRVRSAAERAAELDIAVPGASLQSAPTVAGDLSNHAAAAAVSPEPLVPAAVDDATAPAVAAQAEPRPIYSATADAHAADAGLSDHLNDVSEPASVPPTVASVPVEAPKKRGFFSRLFGRDEVETSGTVVAVPEPPTASPSDFDPSPEAVLADSTSVGEGQAVSSGAAVAAAPFGAHADVEPAGVGSGRTLIELESQSDGMNRFPHTDMPHTKSARTETQIERIIEAVTSLYAERADGVNDLEMGLDFASLPKVPKGFDAPWSGAITRQIWDSQERVSRDLFGVYASALENSHQVKAFSEIPLIRETGIQEARGQFDIISFIDGRTSHLDEPTSSELTTGEIGGRFLEDRTEGEIGVRKQFVTGTEVALSNRLSTLDNNSQFTNPNPQTSSEIVVSVTQPLLAGGGYHYNSTRLKVAKLDSKMAAAEYLRQLESYLLEVNRAYWGVYLARAGYLQKRSLVDRTEGIVGQLQGRQGVDESANLSELLRARSSLAQRRASLIRSAMAIRTAEARLRALVNDPQYSLGSSSEFVPSTLPILAGPKENIRDVALDAITNRAEVLQSVYQVKAAGLLRDQQKRDLLPTLNLILEATSAGLDANRDLGGAYDDNTNNDLGWLAGVQFQVPWERNFAKARVSRRNYELRQQQHQLRSTIDNVLLEAIVAYQELRTSYRDMQGKYQAVLATREELEQLEGRLDVDTDDERSVGYQLQLILDSIERNEASEEQFLVSVVLYNVSFTSLDRARGTLLRQHGVEIRREGDGDMETIEAGLGSRPVDGGGKSGGVK